MQLFIKGLPVEIKADSSIEYITENRLFTDAEAYTLDITLPLRDCIANRKVFGFLNRLDFISREVALPAELRLGAIVKRGSVTVIGISEAEVKVQFLEGKSASNFSADLDNNYINEMSLCKVVHSYRPNLYQKTIDDGVDYVALMWSNGASNWYDNNEYKNGTWNVDQYGLSFMPYLIFIAKRICEEVGLTPDFTEWEQSDDRFLLICNVLPASWAIQELARALPHWSVNEFFSELERLMFCEFNIDLNARTISMHYLQYSAEQRSVVRLENVVDAFSCDVSENAALKTRFGSTIRYAERGDAKEDPEWARDECSWVMDSAQNIRYFASLKALEAYFDQKMYGPGFINNYGPLTKADFIDGYTGAMDWCEFSDYGYYYAVDVGAQFFAKLEKRTVAGMPGAAAWQVNCWLPVFTEFNVFAAWVSPDPNAEEVELKCLPARIASFNNIPRLLLTPSAFSEQGQANVEVFQPEVFRLMSIGKPADLAQYYDKLFLAYWDKAAAARHDVCPTTDKRFSLFNRHRAAFGSLAINASEVFKVSFLAEEIPDVRSEFIIKGRRFLCSKVTATFTKAGMSQLLRGEFYPIDDENSVSAQEEEP